MKSSKLSRASVVALCLALVACAGATTSNPGGGGGGGGANSDYRLPLNDAGIVADFAVPKPGTNCQVQHTSAIYSTSESRAPWWPRINWANDRYGVTLMQPFHVESRELYKVAMITLDRAGQVMNGPEWITPEPTGYSFGPGAIVGLSKGFGLVWADSREDTKSFKSDLYYQRVNENGKPQGGPVKLTSSGKATFPSMDAPGFVAIEGPRQVRELAVVWSDSRNIIEAQDPYGYSSGGRKDIYFKKIDIDGQELLAEQSITTAESKPYPSWPALAYDGTGYALAWENSPPSGGANDRFLMLLDLDGGAKSPETELGQDYGLMSSAPDLVATDTEYGITYSENRSKDTGRVRFSRIDKRGEMMAAQQATALENPCTPAIAYNGERYAVVWQSNCGQDGSALKFALLDDGGHPLAPDGSSCFGSTDPECGVITVSPPSEGVAAFPDIIGVAGRFAVTWMNAPEKKIYFSHIVCSPN